MVSSFLFSFFRRAISFFASLTVLHSFFAILLFFLSKYDSFATLGGVVFHQYLLYAAAVALA